MQADSHRHGIVGTRIGARQKLDTGAMHVPYQLLVAVQQRADASHPPVKCFRREVLHVQRPASAVSIRQEALQQGERGRLPGGILHERLEQRRGFRVVIGIEQALRIGKSELERALHRKWRGRSW